ncbi:MAG: hypothetical protein JXB40_04080 [Candidatus Omnitrophica bacterium]|nr:hypothetical protein [Candidatus Omnitrophota bacterium]
MAKMTRSIEGIQRRMENVEEGSVRHRALQSAKNFKTSWIELGQCLYSVWKDKLYKTWGYMTFEAYTAKEIGIKQATAMKLLKSYYFLEREEPVYLEKDRAADSPAVAVPSYESVNLLRLAKDRKVVDPADYAALKRDVFESGKDAGEIRKSLTSAIRQREELDPEEARQKRRSVTLRKFVGTLKALKRDLEIAKMLPGPVMKEVASLIAKIESQIVNR